MNQAEQLRTTLERAADMINPATGTVRLVSRSVLDLFQIMQRRTGQPFNHTIGGVPPPNLTVSELIEHCGIENGHDEATRLLNARQTFQLLTGRELPETHNPLPFIDDLFMERGLDSNDLHQAIADAISRLPEPAGSNPRAPAHISHQPLPEAAITATSSDAQPFTTSVTASGVPVRVVPKGWRPPDNCLILSADELACLSEWRVLDGFFFV